MNDVQIEPGGMVEAALLLGGVITEITELPESDSEEEAGKEICETN